MNLDCSQVVGEECGYTAEAASLDELQKNLHRHFAQNHEAWYVEMTKTKGRDAIDTQIRLVYEKEGVDT